MMVFGVGFLLHFSNLLGIFSSALWLVYAVLGVFIDVCIGTRFCRRVILVGASMLRKIQTG